ncbi:MAG: hypothetical protein ACXADF_14900 [Candidatus Thorarchaeota archaeon]|jgi:hypothetical protein
MTTLNSESDLRNFGFIPLTGEACGMSMRRLYDLKPQAVRILEAFLSIKVETGNNWNSSEGQVASIMMPYAMVEPLSIFCLFYVMEYDMVVVVNHRCESHTAHFIKGYHRDQWKEDLEDYRMLYARNFRVYNRAGNADGGTRHQHYMSGRVR